MENNGAGVQVGFFGLLTILFIGLKLTGFIDWTWFWVLSPILIPAMIIVGFLIIGWIMYLMTN